MTCSIDANIKGWTSEDGTNFKCVVTQPINSPGFSLTTLNDTFLVCGVQSGVYSGWDLTSN